MKIDENFLHYIWNYNLFNPDYLQFQGAKIEVLDRGTGNKSSGPDFFNAKIRMNNTVWAGNVEIHVKASDWFRHGHQDDPAYDNIILHVVFDDDMAVYRKNGEEIPFIRINFNPGLFEKYKKLISKGGEPECVKYIPGLELVYVRDWLGKLMINRLFHKSEQTGQLLRDNHYDWEDALYKILAQSFGMKLNAQPFLHLAETVPLQFVMKNRKSPLTLNAAFFGQAGFLDEIISDDVYYSGLQKEYMSIRQLLPSPFLKRHLWKTMRSRPSGFPLVRIPQFIQFVKTSFPLFEKIIQEEDVKILNGLIRKGTDKYWVHHFLYGKSGRRKQYMPGNDTIRGIIINSFVIIQFYYGYMKKDESMKGRALELLENLPPENNEIIKKWDKFGMKAENAFDSQALIELETRYCRPRKCLDCMIGLRVLKE